MPGELRGVPVALLGPGAVGRAYLRRLVAQRAHHARHHGVRLRVVAVADSSGVVAAGGRELDDGELTAIVADKAAGRGLASSRAVVQPSDTDWAGLSARRDRPIAVDGTASDTAALLTTLRGMGWRLVLANKLPLTGDADVFRALTRAGRGARWETTVASSLPVVATLQALVAAGDRVHRLTGALSGSLGYVCGRLAAGDALSEIVATAGRQGLLEPDPRADLGGLDTARKALILARMLGWSIEIADVESRGLYPAAWNDLSAEEFTARLPELDDGLARRSADAARAGRTLRFVATLADGRVRVGPEALEPTDRLARVEPEDSIVVFETELFSSNPLVISGRGGGPEATAAGVLADTLNLAACDAP